MTKIPEDIASIAKTVATSVSFASHEAASMLIGRSILAERERLKIVGFTNFENIQMAKADADLGCFHAVQSDEYPIAIYVNCREKEA